MITAVSYDKKRRRNAKTHSQRPSSSGPSLRRWSTGTSNHLHCLLLNCPNGIFDLPVHTQLQRHQIPSQYASESRDAARVLTLDGYGLACHVRGVRDASGSNVRQPASDNSVKPRERFAGDIERKTVSRKSMPDLDADACELCVVIKKHAGMFARDRFDAVRLAKMGLHYRLQLADVITDACGRARSGQVEEGIADNLAGAMVGGLSTALRRHAIRADAPEAQSLLRNLLRRFELSAAKGVDGAMLKEQEVVFMIAGRFTSEELMSMYTLLQSQRACVR